MSKFYTNVKTSGNYLLYRGIENGRRIQEKIKFRPTLYVRTDNDTKFTGFDGEPVAPMDFPSIQDYHEYVRENKDTAELYGNEQVHYQYIRKEFSGDIEYDPSLIRISTLDIETTVNNGFPDYKDPTEEVTVLTIHQKWNDEYHVFYNGERTNTWKPSKANMIAHRAEDETDLFYKFLDHWVDNYPDVVTNWNGEVFDIPYLVCRMSRVIGTDVYSLSPWGQIQQRKFHNQYGQEQFKYNIIGIENLDYLQLYKKFILKMRDNYTLDNIGLVELGEQKIGYGQYKSFKQFYEEDFDTFIDYNIRDVELVSRLDDKLKLLELVFIIAYFAKINYPDIHSPVRTWEALISMNLAQDNVIAPPKRIAMASEGYDGAYVKAPVPGMYDWVCSFDLNSLYPSLIMQFNISPETLVEEKCNIDIQKLITKEFDTSEFQNSGKCLTGSGYCFTTEKEGIFPKMMDKLYTGRKIYKKQMLEEQQILEDIKAEKARRGL